MNAPRLSTTDAACLTWGTVGLSDFVSYVPTVLSCALTVLGICWYSIQIYQWIRNRKKTNG